MHRKILVAGVAISAALLAACSSGSSTSTPAASSAAPAASSAAPAASSAAPAAPMDDSNCADPAVICVGLVTDTGKVDDKSFNQSAWEGAQAGAAAVNGFSKYIETTDPKDYAANIQQFVDKGYDTVVTVGFLMGEATAAAAKANPNVNFIGVDQFNAAEATAQPNLTGLIFPEDQAGYAAGYLAGLMTKTNKIGAVLGTDTVPPVKRFGEGYAAGAKAANPNIDVTLVYHAPDNAFNDPEWGAAEAQKQLAQGADIIFGAGGNTGNGALIEIAKSKGAGESVFCIGVDTDQWNTVPQAQKCLLTSAMKLLADGTSSLVGQAADGSFPGGNYLGGVALADFHDTAAAVPADVAQKVKDVIAGLGDGSVKTGVQ